MKFKKVKRFLLMTGLWMPPVITAGAAYGLYRFGASITPEALLSVAGCSLLAPLYTWSLNVQAIANGVKDFPLIPTKAYVETHPDWQASFRKKALQKEVPEELLSKKPEEGIVLGKYDGQFVRVLPGAKGAAHTLVLGGSGSGKTSSVLLCTLLANQTEQLAFIMVDVKGELKEKGFSEGAKLKVFNPRNREQCGFDFFYDLTPASSEEKVLEVMRRVVYSLFPKKQTSNSDEFWTDGPRNIVLGLFLYGWKEKGLHNLPDLVDFTLSKNLKELINEVLSEVSEYSVVSKLLVSFGGEETAEETQTLSSLAMTIIIGLQLVATDQSLRYLLREAEEKITPAIVNEGWSIDLQIEDAYLDQYAPILNLCVSTCISHLLARKESSENQKVLLVLDELGRIANSSGQVGYGSGSIQALLQIGRSKNAFALLALQSWSALQGVYSEGAMTDMLSNLPYRLILNASPEDRLMTEMCVKAFGKYTEKRRQVSTGKQGHYSYSFEEKDILQEKDLLSLPDQGKVVLLSPYGAFFLRKCQYFNEKFFMKRRNEK